MDYLIFVKKEHDFERKMFSPTVHCNIDCFIFTKTLNAARRGDQWSPDEY